MTDLAPNWWPLARLGEAIEALALDAGLIRDPPTDPLVVPAAFALEDVPRWTEWAAARLGVEVVDVETPASAIDAVLASGGPAILLDDTAEGPGFFALAGRRRGGVLLLDRQAHRRRVPIGTLRDRLVEPVAAEHHATVDELLDRAMIQPRRRPRAAAALLHERLQAERIGGISLLRAPASAPVWRQMRLDGGLRTLALIVAAFVALYVLEIAGWKVIGEGVLAGKVDSGWLLGWMVILLTAVVAQTASAWCEASLAVDLGRIMKARLLAGALALRPDAIKRSGVGQMIGRVIEAQALEALTFNGGIGVLLAGIELVFTAWVLAHGAAPAAHLTLLVGWVVLTGLLGWRYFVRMRQWSGERLDMTNALIEAMVGHRTRLAQDRAARRDAQDDAVVQRYLTTSAAMDGASIVGVTALPSIWLLAGIAALVPAFAGQPVPSPVTLAISLGGLLLGQRAFGGIAGGSAGLARAAIAWSRVRDLFAASRGGAVTVTRRTDGIADEDRPVIEAEGLMFRYPGADRRVVDRANLTIRHGEKILLDGASGGGKSTLAALLTGLETPTSGLLLLDGLDKATRGDAWHRLAAAAPQFHDNHILSGSLAFNLLMARSWPPTSADLADATELCEELGLGDLLSRMPGGLEQQVGETGWQLSHGERSRIFLARALLQRASLTILDESFASLDPQRLGQCLAAAISRSQALVVITHR